MPQLTTMTFQSGTSLNFRCPYQAKVIKIFEPISKKMVHIVRFNLHAIKWEAERKKTKSVTMADILEQLHQQIQKACRRADRSDSEVALMAVTKVHPVEVILEAYAAGQRLFGENRVQEFQEKSQHLTAQHPEIFTDAKFHLIGPLQSNKTAKAAELFHAID